MSQVHCTLLLLLLQLRLRPADVRSRRLGAPAPCDRASTEALQHRAPCPQRWGGKGRNLGGSACGWHRSLNCGVRVVTE